MQCQIASYRMLSDSCDKLLSKMTKQDEIQKAVLDHYERLSKEEITTREDARTVTESLGYKQEDLASLPAGVDLGLGCGNPHESAKPQEGETVLDLGSGRGLDCFLAAKVVGKTGRVVGLDASPDMVKKANAVAMKQGFDNCSFVRGEIESIPLPSDHFDLVISNCVINLSRQKERVYEEIFRVLKPGGRVAISDITAKQALPAEWVADPHMAKT